MGAATSGGHTTSVADAGSDRVRGGCQYVEVPPHGVAKGESELPPLYTLTMLSRWKTPRLRTLTVPALMLLAVDVLECGRHW